MLNKLYEQYLFYLQEEVTLVDLDKDLLKRIQGRNKIGTGKNRIYYTIMYNGDKAGIVGYVSSKPKREDAGFVQIVIKRKYRGKGILKDAYDLIVKKYKVKTLLVSISDKNIPSIKAHEKVGFKKVSVEENQKLRDLDYLSKGYSRYEKEY